MNRRFPRTVLVLIATISLLFGSIVTSVIAAQEATPATDATPIDSATPVDSATPAANSATTDPVDLDVLFIGAHPDDEAGGLAAYGQWNEFHDV